MLFNRALFRRKAAVRGETYFILFYFISSFSSGNRFVFVQFATCIIEQVLPIVHLNTMRIFSKHLLRLIKFFNLTNNSFCLKRSRDLFDRFHSSTCFQIRLSWPRFSPTQRYVRHIQ